MERLTERTADGILVKENYEKESLKTLYSCYGEKPNSHYSNCEEGYCAMEKLADYEDAEEQGRRDRRQTNADRIRNMSDEELAAIDKGIAIATGRAEYPKKPYKPRYKNHY